MREHFLKYNDIYYLDESCINSMYSQLTENIQSSSIEKGKYSDISFSVKVANFILRLFGKETSVDTGVNVGFSKTESFTRGKTLIDKFHDVLNVIDEKEFKDIFQLIEQYMDDEKSIIAIGKGEFLPLLLQKDAECTELKGVNFPIESNELEYILFSGIIEKESNYKEVFDKLNPDLQSKVGQAIPMPDIIFSSEKEVTETIYSQRVYVVMDTNKLMDKFSMYYTADRTYYFLGKIIEFEEDYFIIPYALWRRAVIL